MYKYILFSEQCSLQHHFRSQPQAIHYDVNTSVIDYEVKLGVVICMCNLIGGKSALGN